MEAIRGTITKFIYKHPGSGWKIARFKPEEGAEFGIKGDIAESNLDFDVTIKGEWVENGAYGREFQVSSVIRSAPNSVESVRDWLAREVKGIGKETAQRLADKFGSDLKKIIETDPVRLTEVKRVSKAIALEVSMSWIKDATLREVQLFLTQSNVSDKLARKVVNLFGQNSIQIIQDNPYRLTQVSGIGFKTADKMALGMGWSVQRPERLDAALAYLLQEAFTEGHSFLYKGELIEKVCRLAEIETENGTELLSEQLALSALARIVKIGSVKEETITINNLTQYLYYLPHVYALEKEAAERLARLQSTPHVPPQNIGKILAKVEKELSLQLSERQKEGVISVIANNCSIITGLPGTGKTSTVRALVNTARALGLTIELAAPTGRAAKRLSEVTNLQARTIHRLLQFDPISGGFVYDENNKLPCNMLILDEVSMIDLELMVAVLRAVPNDCSVAWIGDVNQLASIGAGTVLRDLINSKQVPTTVLDKIFRQAEGSLIIQNAHRIHRGEMPAFPLKGGDGDSFWVKVPRAKNENTGQTTDDLEFVKTKLEDIYKRLESKYGFDPIKDIQVLTPMRVGPAGYNMFNGIIQNIVNPDGDRIEINGNTYRVGDRVMQIKNDYTLDVYNGDVGFIREVLMDDKGLLIEWTDDRDDQIYPFDSLDNLVLAYAVSVHKAQGSEFKCCILLFLNHHYVMLDRNLIYTANTRARKMAIYLASFGAIETAVRTQKVEKRNSLLAQRIRKAVEAEKKFLSASYSVKQRSVAA
jgi:exodeoxyribonuclease V alpha subunit